MNVSGAGSNLVTEVLLVTPFLLLVSCVMAILPIASELGISQESAANALAETVPQVVDQATAGEGTIMDEMLSNAGGPNGAMEMLGKMFR